jgi:hypothetical protein
MTELESSIEELARSPKDQGRLELIVRRPVKGQREVLAEGELTFEEGLAGDCWKDRDPHPDMQINIMNARAIAAIAATKEDWSLAGDQLFVDLDLSGMNLPPGRSWRWATRFWKLLLLRTPVAANSRSDLVSTR